MELKYFTEEITVTADGQTPVLITPKNSKEEAMSGVCQVMASGYINKDVRSIHAEAKDNLGGVYLSLSHENTLTIAETEE